MRRRDILTLICSAALLLPLRLRAQALPDKVYRLGVLTIADPTIPTIRDVTLPELARLGFVVGKNLILDVRAGPPEKLQELARELVAFRPDVIIAIADPAIRAAKAASNTTPIVMGFAGDDPVGAGYAESLNRPNRNITGIVMLPAELNTKRLELLREAVPFARRIAVLEFPGSYRGFEPANPPATFKVDLLTLQAADPADYPALFAEMRNAGVQALMIGNGPTAYEHREHLAELALNSGLPAICEWREGAQKGMMLGYGPNIADLRRRTADFVVRIFRGTPPAEIPIERPTRYDFAINLRTSRSLGIDLPASILLRADEVIE
jgi:putative ABC transport system substrate-binding protein